MNPGDFGVRPWMRQPEVAAVIAALEAEGGAGCARFVGGCVRDTLVGRPVGDVDIATTLTPDRVIAALKAARLKAVPTGLDHGTVTAVSAGRPFEITTLRRDVETDGRHAVVAFTDDWGQDAQRRDFRLNALYADPQGRLYDPTGAGLADAEAGRVVFVGDPALRIAEDALRILRFFRFQAWYGRLEPDPAGLAACQAAREALRGLSAERVSKELLRLLAAEDPRPAMAAMVATGVLAVILPQACDLPRFEGLAAVETGQTFEADAELRLAAMLPDDPAVGAQVASGLRLSNRQRDRLGAALRPEPSLRADTGPREARRMLYRIDVQAFCDRALLAWALAPEAEAADWRALIALGRTWTRPVLPVTGEDALAAGAVAGPAVGAALRAVEAWWVDQDFPDDRDAALQALAHAATQGAKSAQ